MVAISKFVKVIAKQMFHNSYPLLIIEANKKAQGSGSIPPELLKYGSEKLYKHFAELYQICDEGTEISDKWNKAHVYKRGHREVCENYCRNHKSYQ